MKDAASVCPAHAGMFLNAIANQAFWDGLPRSRGDVPSHRAGSDRASESAPLTRGCSPLAFKKNLAPLVCPAHAGMFPEYDAPAEDFQSLPRSRGDVPLQLFRLFHAIASAPLTRGCSPTHHGSVLNAFVCPAHAGMFPYLVASRQSRSSLPRSRGDVPPPPAHTPRLPWSAPLTRGCSPVPRDSL